MTSILHKCARWFGAATGVGVPAYSFFSSYSPPLFPSISLITAALACAIFVTITLTSRRRQKADPSLKQIMCAWLCLIAAICLIIGYILLFQYTTVVISPSDNQRLQIGFGTAEWTLTQTGREAKQRRPTLTASELLRNEADFAQERVPRLWQNWSIYAAGFGLIVLYLPGFLLWTTGFSILGIKSSPS